MSKATKRKHVVKEVLSDYVQPTEHQLIVRVLGSPGNNLHEIETSEGEKFLASMPTKFRKNIWIKRGDYLIVDPIAEGDKVKAEISFILYKDHQRLLQKEGLWPSGFEKKTESVTESKESNQRAEADAPETKPSDESGTDSEDDSDLFVNTNRVHYEDSEEEESESDEEEK
uniref:Probable RNA-binding protein EIF1AD n=1 Tax=Leptobrachium leishanense TaxID=445787 RepID=A0A8C5N1E8_9ANUR